MSETDALKTRVAELEAENEALRVALASARDHERFVDSIVENLPDMIFVKDAAELRFVRFNAAGESLLGLDRATLIGKNDFDFFPPEQAEAFVAKDHEVLAGRAVVDIPEEPIHTAGGLRYLHTKKIPILDDQGTPIYLLGISEDITERKAAAEALAARTAELVRTSAQLRQSELRLRLLLERFPGAMWTTDAGLRLLSYAGALATKLRLDRAVGEPIQDALPAAGPDADVVALHQAALAGESVGYEMFHEGRAAEVRLVPFDDGGKSGVIGVALDVTEHRRVESERLRATLQRTQRMETLGLLAGGVAHDFNNLLGAILGNASLALVRLPAEAAARQDIERVVGSAEMAAELTRQLLAYSGKGRFVVEPVDLSAVVEGISGLLRVSLDKNASLHLRISRSLPRCAVDVAQIRQVVLNLLTNANDALEGQPGHITVTTSVITADRGYLAQAWLDEALPEGRYVCLEVSDTGVGMTPETVNRMFDPLFTTKPKGHGLGLAATLGIVRGHRGAIRVYSEPGAGTTIKVLFPAIAEAAPVMEAPAPTVREPPTSGAVLVVDDEEVIRDFVTAALATRKVRAFCAGDGEEALAVFRAHTDEIEVVLLDLTMPRMSGEETLRELLRIRPKVRVILSSGYNEQDATSRFAGKGLAGFLQKPYRVADLFEKIEESRGRR